MTRVAPALPASLRALLHEGIDYAGLFPPAELPMGEAVANYGAYRAGAEAWALGRFVLPAARFAEFAVAAEAVEGGRAPWPLSVLVGLDAGLGPVLNDFNRRFGARWCVDCVEGRAETAAGVEAHGAYVRAGFATFVEIAPDAAVDALAEAIGAVGAAAKIRTGGVTATAFPPAVAVLRFLRACQRAGIAFKATAGLHHALLGDYRLTYRPDSPTGTMFGYLNVMVAAALVVSGAGDQDVLDALTAGRSADFKASDAAVSVGGHAVGIGELKAARSRFMKGFGSCSFREPLDEAAELTLHA